MPVTVTTRDTGYGALLKRLGLSEPKTDVTIGVHEAEGSENDDESELTVAEIAAINEFGGPDNNPPERSWLRAWADETEAENRKRLIKLMQAVTTGKIVSKEQALEQFGTLAVAEIQKRIRGGIAPEQADSTAARKGSATPLIDSGQFWGSITYKVT